MLINFGLCVIFIQEVLSLKCYQCTNMPSNDMCNKEEHVTDCEDISPPGITLDMCQTRVKHNEEGKMMISKRCVQGPCTLGDDQNMALGFSGCSSNSNDCEHCCKIDKCNISAVNNIIPSIYLLIFCIFYIFA